MTDAAMQQLLDEESLRFEPVGGTYDLAAVRAYIATLGFSFEDETFPGTFVVASTASSRDRLQAHRRANPADGFPPALLITIAAAEINVAPATDGGLEALSAAFIAWLAQLQPCRLLNDFGTDLTALLPAA